MKFLHYILIAFLALSFAGCSDEDREPETPTELETAPKAKIFNPDGTYYALHEGYISLRNSDDSQIKRIYFEAPTPLSVNIGYGQEATVNYLPSCFDFLGNNIVVGYYAMYRNMDKVDFCFGPGYVYEFDKSLATSSKKEIKNGFLTIGDNMLLSVNHHFGFTLYDASLRVIKSASDFENVEYSPNRNGLLTEIKGKYYILCSVRHPNTGYSDAVVNLSDEICRDILLPDVEDVVNSHFPNETNKPRLEDKSFGIGDDCFTVTYTFKLYDGSTKQITFNIDTYGLVVDESANIPPMPVYINLSGASMWATFGAYYPLDTRYFNVEQGVPSGFPYTANSFTGFGGVLLVHNAMGQVCAYDASCPYEHRKDVVLRVDHNDFQAVCPSCGSRFEIINGNGVPMSDKALELGFALKSYKVTPSDKGYIITN